MRRIILGDCLEVLPRLPRAFARLVYIDPPFNTGRLQRRDRMRVRSVAAETEKPTPGEARALRSGFKGRRYEVARVRSSAFADRFDDYTSFLLPRIEAALPCMTADASIFVHLDYREVHYVKVALDALLGRDSFMNEIIWAYDYGARSKSRWPAKHDTILWYARDPKSYVFEYDAIDRIPYMAPGLVTKEKAARGKTPTDVWWHTIVPTNGREKTGYPTQKPLGIVGGSCACTRGPATWPSTSSLGAAPSARPRPTRARLRARRSDRDACRVASRRLGP
ncbi:MAG: site-specific DNA-methyltransferase [Polyangiaceae bacterium]